MAEFGGDHKPLVACLSFVMMQSGSYAKVELLRAAIAHEYRIRMLSSPTTHEAISVLFRGFKNAHPHERQARLPITEEILTKMCAQLYQPIHGRYGLLTSVVLWRTIWRVCLEYHALGRFSDIVKLKLVKMLPTSQVRHRILKLFSKEARMINTLKAVKEWLPPILIVSPVQ